MHVSSTYRPQNQLHPQGNLSATASYTFSAKEKDSETGLSYFGARYYTSDLSVWLSVDPMSDMFPSVSPFIYCNNNPIRLTDPNGESPISLGAKFAAKKATKAVTKALIKNLVTDRLSAYASKKWAQQLLSDALDMVGVLSGQSWWEYAIEVIPIVGDVYGGYKLGKQGVAIAKYLDRFEKRVNALAGALSKTGSLRSTMKGIKTGEEAHHLIPVQVLKESSVVQDAVSAGFNFNDVW